MMSEKVPSCSPVEGRWGVFGDGEYDIDYLGETSTVVVSAGFLVVSLSLFSPLILYELKHLE